MRTWPWIASTAALALALGWTTLQNRDLERALAQRSQEPPRAAPPSASANAPAAEAAPARGGLAQLARAFSTPAPPALEEPAKESRAERRARRQVEVAAIFGRLPGESEAEYRERVGPFIAMALDRPRQRAVELRREAEQKAGVTAEQSAKLDQLFATTYEEVLEYTNAAVAEGQLSPYQRNVSGWLGYAGGLGGILGAVEKDASSILRPEQVKALAEAGFEWGEFLGVTAPWEKLRAPPPPRD